jgi:hypothetical protein
MSNAAIQLGDSHGLALVLVFVGLWDCGIAGGNWGLFRSF